MSTAWPWPGVTACAEVNSALSSKRSSPRIGHPARQRVACWLARITNVRQTAGQDQATIAMKSLQVLSDRAPHGTAAGLGGADAPRPGR